MKGNAEGGNLLLWGSIVLAVFALLAISLISCGPTPPAPGSIPVTNNENVVQRAEFPEDNVVCYYIYTSGTIRLTMDCVYLFDDMERVLKELDYGY